MIFDRLFEIVNSIKQKWKNRREAKKYAQTNESTRLSKEEATAKKKPWVAVLDTHVNPENIRNGFFELDWNEFFILELTAAGYVGKNEEEIVDAWFTELCNNLGQEANINMNNRGSGYVNRALRDDGRTEIS